MAHQLPPVDALVAKVRALGVALPAGRMRVDAFGDSPGLSESLLALIVSGRKRAGTSLLWAAEADGDPLPQVGDIAIVVDHANEPVLLTRTVRAFVVPFDEVSAEYAAIEGEGDGSLKYWREGHWAFFSRECVRLGRAPDPKMPVVCDVFELLAVLPRRAWQSILARLPDLEGQTVLDLGCGSGEQAGALAARGARVIGLDMKEDALREARTRAIPGAEFRAADLREPIDSGVEVDGVWGSYVAAYFPDLAAVLPQWTRRLKPGGWIALTEIDDLFGHEPLDARARALLEGYARDALLANRYDVHAGRRLGIHLARAGFTVSVSVTVEDPELAFEGAAGPEVLDAWRARFDRMTLLAEFCGPEFGQVRDGFLGCLARPDHRSIAKVYGCIGTR